jgi:hypothetical protein
MDLNQMLTVTVVMLVLELEVEPVLMDLNQMLTVTVVMLVLELEEDVILSMGALTAKEPLRIPSTKITLESCTILQLILFCIRRDNSKDGSLERRGV